MSTQSLILRDYRSLEPLEISWRDGLITKISKAPAKRPPRNLFIAPALFDVQVNGYAGVDFQDDAITEAALVKAAHALRRDGCPTFLLTLITDGWAKLTTRLDRLVKLRERSPELTAAIAGWHIEGPFLSDQPGFHGAHDPACMRNPRPEDIRKLRDITGKSPLLLTIAPERPGALTAIKLARRLGLTISLGHTNASFETIAVAIKAGATGFTHLGNGCPNSLDRHDNIIWRVADAHALTASLIPDGIHVSPAPFRALHRLLPPDRIIYTTDAMAAAGAGPGKYRIGRLEVAVGKDRIVRQPGKSNFAGSSLRPFEGVFKAAEMTGEPWQTTWNRLSVCPKMFMAMDPTMGVGSPATFCVVKTNQKQQLAGLTTYFLGTPEPGLT
jgi:N-acetylglucosamine-6-phosphate deacetylase